MNPQRRGSTRAARFVNLRIKMKKSCLPPGASSNPLHALQTAGATMLLLLALSPAAQALDYTYTIYAGRITITGYTGLRRRGNDPRRDQ